MKILRHSAEWMRSVGTAPGGSKTNWLTAVILYDDAQLAHAASAKCREIEQNVGSAKIYALRTINLNTLPDNQQSSQMASTEAASADLVFLCVHPDRQLTRWTQLWMRDWASNRSNPRGALVHFCHQEHFGDWQNSLMREFLETVASLGQMELVETSVEAGTAQPAQILTGLN